VGGFRFTVEAGTVTALWIESGDDANRIDRALAKLTNLRRLEFQGSPLTAAGLPQLGNLILVGQDITDAGMKHIEGLTALRGLYLSGMGITDAGLASLETMTELRSLNVFPSAVTRDGMAALKSKLPKLEMTCPDPSGMC